MAGADGAGCSVFRAFIQKSDFELRSIAYGFFQLVFSICVFAAEPVVLSPDAH